MVRQRSLGVRSLGKSSRDARQKHAAIHTPTVALPRRHRRDRRAGASKTRDAFCISPRASPCPSGRVWRGHAGWSRRLRRICVAVDRPRPRRRHANRPDGMLAVMGGSMVFHLRPPRGVRGAYKTLWVPAARHSRPSPSANRGRFGRISGRVAGARWTR